MPDPQVAPNGHSSPQSKQFFESEKTSVHVPPQQRGSWPASQSESLAHGTLPPVEPLVVEPPETPPLDPIEPVVPEDADAPVDAVLAGPPPPEVDAPEEFPCEPGLVEQAPRVMSATAARGHGTCRLMLG